jgi:hypothetical protein
MDMMVIPNRARVVAVLPALALAGGLLTLALLAKPTQAQPTQAQPTQAQPTQAQGQGATVQDFPVSGGIDSTNCTGEVILIEGTMHTVSILKAREDGGYRFTDHFNFSNVKGVGETTGEEYVINIKSTVVEKFVPDGEFATGTVFTSGVVSKGSMPNEQLLSRVHFIQNDDGTIKMENIQFRFECQD